MKILVFLPTYTLTIQQGDTTHIKELVGNLSRLAEVAVVHANDAEASERVPFIMKTLRVLRGFTKAVFLILKRRPDLIYTRSSQAIYTLLLAKLFRLPFIIEVNGLFIDEWNMEGGTSIISRWIGYNKDLLNEKIYKFADHLIVVTPKIKEVLETERKINPLKMSVIENGANTELFRPTDTNEARRKLELDEVRNYICFVGTLYKWQGVEYLIKASPYVLEAYPQSSFLIIGDGPSRESLNKLAEQFGVSDKFIFTGIVPYEEVHLYINSSDICVVPRPPIKGSPLKLCEYMACEKPVIASDIDGVREILDESKSGICVLPKSSHELAKAIIDLLRNPESRENMGKNGRRYIVKNRSWESVARKVFEVCQMVVQKH